MHSLKFLAKLQVAPSVFNDNLRILLSTKSEKFKNIEVRQKFGSVLKQIMQ